MRHTRTNYLGNLTKENVGQKVCVMGWVKKHRDLGELIFMDMKDIKGLSQVVITNDSVIFEEAKALKVEYVVSIVGTVRMRQDINPNIETGEIEIIAEDLEILNKSEAVPIQIQDNIDASEDTRLEYRYLDLRRDEMQKKLISRHKLTSSVREFLNNNDFIDIETPILTKATPEGARDYLVPSRVNPGEFYALPQSPQIYKNLLMIGGFERYYQIVKCFRDEDLRADRQPEFTQIDLEMSFMNEQAIRDLMEDMIKKVMFDVKGLIFKEKFPVMKYIDAMDNYGCDKPDLRFDMKIVNVDDVFINSDFAVFKNAETIRLLNVVDAANKFSRKDIDKLEVLAKKHHAKGMAWLKLIEGELTGPIVKFFSEAEKEALIKKANVENNALLLFAADSFDVVCQSLAALRNHLGQVLSLIDDDDFKFVWITEWPMFEYDTELDRLFAMHHPFTQPTNDKFCDNPIETQAQAYDIVLNGLELGGGSIRINNAKTQQEMFRLLNMEQKEIDEKFGFFVDAYKYGAPYHGGIALGLDRFAMILTNSSSIRDVIAFPKNNRARELLMDSPTPVSQEQLDELSIMVNND